MARTINTPPEVWYFNTKMMNPGVRSLVFSKRREAVVGENHSVKPVAIERYHTYKSARLRAKELAASYHCVTIEVIE